MYTNIAEVQNIQNLWITSANLKLHHLSIGGIAYFAKTPHVAQTLRHYFSNLQGSSICFTA